MSVWRQLTGLFKNGLFLAILIIVLVITFVSDPKKIFSSRKKAQPALAKSTRQKLDKIPKIFVPVKIMSVKAQVPPDVSEFINSKLEEAAALMAIAPLANPQGVLSHQFTDLSEPRLEGVTWRFGDTPGWWVKGDEAWTNPACSEGIRVAQKVTLPDSQEQPCLEIDCRAAKYNATISTEGEAWPAYPGQRFTISAKVKASEPNQNLIFIMSYGHPYAQTFQSQTNWTDYSYTAYVNRDRKPGGVYACINFPRGAIYWIKDFTVVRGDNSTESTLTPLQEVAQEIQQSITRGDFVQAWNLVSGWRVSSVLATAREALSHPAWKIIGPFDNTSGQGFAIIYEPEKEMQGTLASEYRDSDGKPIHWIYTYGYEDSGNQGVVDLARYFGQDENWTIYALTQPVSLTDTKCNLALKATGGLKVWLNGQLIYQQPQAPGLDKKPALVPVILKEGPNLLFLKLAHGAGRPAFMAVFTDEGGQPLPFLRLEPP